MMREVFAIIKHQSLDEWFDNRNYERLGLELIDLIPKNIVEEETGFIRIINFGTRENSLVGKIKDLKNGNIYNLIAKEPFSIVLTQNNIVAISNNSIYTNLKLVKEGEEDRETIISAFALVDIKDFFERLLYSMGAVQALNLKYLDEIMAIGYLVEQKEVDEIVDELVISNIDNQIDYYLGKRNFDLVKKLYDRKQQLLGLA